AQGVVGTLDEGAEADEAIGLAAHDGAEGRATKQVRTLLDPLAETADAVTAQALFGDAAHFQPGGVDVLPHVRGDPPAYRMGIAARSLQAAVDAARVARIEGEEIQHALGMQGAVALQII